MININSEKSLFSFYDVLGVRIAASTVDLACQFLESCINKKSKEYVCIAPASTIVDCQKNLKYREVINQAAITTPDGMPLVWLGRLKGYKEVKRTYGPDLLNAFCAYSQNKGYRHFFYGGTLNTNKLLIANFKKKFPELKIAGIISPGFLDVQELEKQEVIDSINHANPDILWVGLGSPKQDYWMSNHRAKLNVPVIVGVGAAFDFIAGTKKQAPRWVQQSGFEWLFRLCSEPRRLWKRYLIGNTQFIMYLFGNCIKSLFIRHAKN